ncbi:MAG: nuclear transport factor 2 family protein [Rhodobacteraceae bacterium]|nr:nuclear transport factor 2 family protein [Paracoccaceae bacterium]
MNEDVIERYFAAFNCDDTAAMLDELSDDVAHHVNEGEIRRGKDLFADFCAHMSDCYAERLTDMVIFASPDGTRAAAEYVVNGTYLKTDGSLPEARGQKYLLPAGSFFTLKDGKIARVTTYYNLSDWLRQVNG